MFVTHDLIHVFFIDVLPAIPILKKHVEYIIDRHTHYTEEGANKPEELGELFSTEWTRAAISTVISQASGHISQVCVDFSGTSEAPTDLGV